MPRAPLVNVRSRGGKGKKGSSKKGRSAKTKLISTTQEQPARAGDEAGQFAADDIQAASRSRRQSQQKSSIIQEHHMVVSGQPEHLKIVDISAEDDNQGVQN